MDIHELWNAMTWKFLFVDVIFDFDARIVAKDVTVRNQWQRMEEPVGVAVELTRNHIQVQFVDTAIPLSTSLCYSFPMEDCTDLWTTGLVAV